MRKRKNWGQRREENFEEKKEEEKEDLGEKRGTGRKKT